MNRAYSILEIKAVQDDQRVITGTATTPSPDRVGDIVEPLGIKFKNPMPLLWQHRSDQPVGTVKFDKPTKDGITFTAQLPKIDDPGPLKDRVDTAWGEVKAGLVRAVSIGFSPIEYSRLEDGGLRFIQSEVLELSLVTIPANAEATIQSIKSIDANDLAALGRKDVGVVEQTPPGAAGIKSTRVVKAQEAKQMKKTIAEQISAFEATRQARSARMDEIMDKAGENNETLDEAASQEYDGLEAEVKQIDEHLVRLRRSESNSVAQAKQVNGRSVEEASASRETRSVVQVKTNVPKGIAFTRLLGAKYLGRLHGRNPADIAKQLFPDTPEVELVLRAPVPAGNTTDTTWAAPLVVQENMASEFVELLRPSTIIGRLPGLRRVPFNISVPRQTGGASVGWVGEGAPKPVSSLAFDSISLRFTKVAGIVPITQELLRFSNPAAEGVIRDDLIAAIAYITDRDFLDPAKAAVTNVSPASVTNGVTPITASGTTGDALRADLVRLIQAYAALNMSLSGLVLVMTSQRAIAISMMTNTLGQTEFPGLGPNGGTLAQIPVITSENMVATGGSPVDGDMIVAINAGDILLADDGQVTIDVSTEASIQMELAPDLPATSSTTFVSAFQQNMAFFRAERVIHWLKRRSGAVQYIQNAKYA